jgi:hypothetical protein
MNTAVLTRFKSGMTKETRAGLAEEQPTHMRVVYDPKWTITFIPRVRKFMAPAGVCVEKRLGLFKLSNSLNNLGYFIGLSCRF